MGNKPSRVRQREIQQVIRGARNEGAKRIEVHIEGNKASVIIPLVEDEQKPVAPDKQITL
jgi:hypothetical protein